MKKLIFTLCCLLLIFNVFANEATHNFSVTTDFAFYPDNTPVVLGEDSDDIVRFSPITGPYKSLEARAVLKYARISSRKVKIVLDLIRNKPVGVAMGILKNTPKSASAYLEKLLASAIANAVNNHNMDVNKLYVSECFATQGPTLKRVRPRAQGRAFRILKRTSHITLVVKEEE